MDAIAKHEQDLSALTLKAAIIYDDFDFAARAAALLERVAIHSDKVVKWDVKPWRLGVLKSSILANAALDETADADLIMVALCKIHSTPTELTDWVESWATKRQIADAAVMVLCPEDNAAPTPLWRELKGFAERHGLPFLGRHIWGDDEDSTNFIINRLWQQKHPPQPVVSKLELSAESSRSPRHWGINE